MTGKYRSYYDLVVAGAGPAGSLTAALAARGGARVLLLEKKRLPREKACGGMISARALALLPPLALPSELSAPVNLVGVETTRGGYYYHAREKVALLTRRSDFDLLLAEYARSCGAELREESPLLNIGPGSTAGRERIPLFKLEAGGSGEPIYGRYLVDARGAESSASALSSPYPRAWGVVGTGPAPDTGSYPARFYPLPVIAGLGWSFTGKGWLNRGVGGLAHPRRLLTFYRRLFPDDRAEKVRAWPLPFAGALRCVARGNLLQVGDAAGIVEPFSGEGIYPALKSAHLASRAVLRALREEENAAPIYSQLFQHYFRRRFPANLYGTFYLHFTAALFPQRLPRVMVAVMHNRYRYC